MTKGYLGRRHKTARVQAAHDEPSDAAGKAAVAAVKPAAVEPPQRKLSPEAQWIKDNGWSGKQ
jgi:hypothetical protein